MASGTTKDANAIIEALLQQLIQQKEAYLESSSRIEGILSDYLALEKGGNGSDSAAVYLSPYHEARLAPADNLSQPDSRPSTEVEVLNNPPSIRTIASGDGDANRTCAFELMKPSNNDLANFRNHLLEYSWDPSARKIIGSILNNGQRMRWPDLFAPEVLPEGRSHYYHCQIVEVDNQGILHSLLNSHRIGGQAQASTVWRAIQKTNNGAQSRDVVGRISILREPSPILFAAIHFANHHVFDTDELLQYLADSVPTTAYIDRLFDLDPRRQRSFVFSFKYFTLPDSGCKPMTWQKSNRHLKSRHGGLSISYCGAVVALSLQSRPLRKIRNQKRSGVPFGYAYDPWGSWEVLHLSAFADRVSNVWLHNKRHYINGVEAFMETILAEYKDANTRLRRVHAEVSMLTTAPVDFVFDSKLFDRLFRDDDELTYSQKYFWAYRTCDLIVDSIRALIDSYENTFTDEVWEGRHKSLWPLLDQDLENPRNKNYRRRMAVTQGRFRHEIDKLKALMAAFTTCRADFISLRDQLSNAISIADSRKAIQQGNNIRLLTLVSIFFLPLTYVTSVFGMNNMPQNTSFVPFGIATVAICVPFFAFIGLLSGRRSIKSRLTGFSMQAWSGTGWKSRQTGEKAHEMDGTYD